MNAPVKFIITAAFASGFAALASNATAMPVAKVGFDTAPATEQAHAVRVCNRWGRCWWTYAGYYPRRYGYGWRGYGWHNPHYGWRHGWGRHYGYGGWRHGYGWRGHWR